MRHVRGGVLCAALTLFAAAPAAAQTGDELFQQALVKERADGDLRGAIAIYERIARDYTADRRLAARALVQLGQCYEKLGSTEAERAYRRVVEEYADQRELVVQARSRLAALRSGAASAGLVARLVWDEARDPYFAGGLSSDGRYLSYIDWNNGAVSLRDLVEDTSYAVAQAEWTAYKTLVSPDGQTVAYQTWDQTARIDVVHLTDRLGSSDRVLYRDAESLAAWPMAWSHDGTSLLTLHIRKDRTQAIASIRTADGSSRVLKTLEGRPADLRMALSPDGRWIAYSYPPAERSSKRDVYLLAVDGSREAAVVEHPADDFVIGWTPDGRRLVIGSDRTGQLGLWTMPLTDGRAGGPLELVRPGVGGWPLGITANGDYYYGVFEGWSDVFVAELEPATGRVVSPPVQAIQQFEGANSSPEWSPDGSALVVRSSRGRSRVAFLVRSSQAGAVHEVHPRVDRMNFHFMSWEPNANTVLVVGAGDDGQYGHVYRVDLATGDAVSIAQPEPEGAIWMPEWSPDGHSVFFSRTGPAGRRIVRRVMATGEETELYRSGRFFLLRVSPSGSDLAFVQNDTIKILNVVTRTARTVVAPGKTVRALAWSGDGAHLLFGAVVDTTTQRTQLMRVAVASGAVQEIPLAMENLMHLKVHPDGRRIAFTAKIRDERVEVWAIEKLFAERRTGGEAGPRR